MVLGRRFKLYFILCVWNIMAAAPPPPPPGGFAFTAGIAPAPGTHNSLFSKTMPSAPSSSAPFTQPPQVAAAPVAAAAATATNSLYGKLAAAIRQRRNNASRRPTASSAANNAAPPLLSLRANAASPPLLALRHEMSIQDPISTIVYAAHQQCLREIQLSNMTKNNIQDGLHTIDKNISIFKIFLKDRDKAEEYIHELLVFFGEIQQNESVTKDAIVKYLQKRHTQQEQKEFADFLTKIIQSGGRRKHKTRHNKKQRKQRKHRRTRKY